MGRLSVFVASRFIDEVEDEFRLAFDATFASPDGTGQHAVVASAEDPFAELSERAADGEGFDVVLFSLDCKMPASRIAELPQQVRALATYSVGTDHIDLEAAARRGLAVFNTPGVLGDSVAENAIFLMLGAARRATESIDLLRSRAWTGWTPTQLVGVELKGRTLGILGMGDIGARIARRAKGLGMEVLYCNRRALPPEHDLAAGYRATPQALAAESDVLMLACPSTEETRGIVDAELLAAAKPGSLLINIARGDLVQDDALISALERGRIRAAGLDVFAGEPEVDPRYFDLPNVFMVPHIGSSTLEARLGMGRILIEGLTRWNAGEEASNRVC